MFLFIPFCRNEGRFDMVSGPPEALELPLVLPDGIDTATVLQKTASDKKFRAGTIRFVLLSKAGEAGISTKITREDMAEAIEELRRPLD